MRIQTTTTQNFKAKLVGFEPIISKVAKQGLPQIAINRALNKIHKYFPGKDNAVIIADKYDIFSRPTEIGVLNHNKIFRFTEVNLENNRNDLYRIVSAVKKLSGAEFTKELDFKKLN